MISASMSHWVYIFVAIGVAVSPAVVATSTPDQAGFQSSVQPFIAKTCYGCHSAKVQSAGLNLERYASADSVAGDRAHWDLILEKLRSGQMPPAGMPRPATSELAVVTKWISSELDREDLAVK